jgi:carbon-monoxide dehydrogenase small subunit
MTRATLNFVVNGKQESLCVDTGKSLLAVLCEDLHLTSVKGGCGQGDCGACVVVMNSKAVNSCLALAGQAQGAAILTVEGLEQNGVLHPLQRHFMEKWAFQCGFCTPGMLMSCYALLLQDPDPTEECIREAVSGNLCRCTNYNHVVEAVRAAANELNLGGRTQERTNG